MNEPFDQTPHDTYDNGSHTPANLSPTERESVNEAPMNEPDENPTANPLSDNEKLTDETNSGHSVDLVNIQRTTYIFMSSHQLNAFAKVYFIVLYQA